MRKIGMLLLAALLALPSCALASIEAQPEAGSEVAAGDTVAYTVTVESDDPDGQVHIVLSKGMELQQDSVMAPEGNLYFGSDGFVLMAELANGDEIKFSATVGEGATEAVCTVTGSLEETICHNIALPAEETASQGEPVQEATQEKQPVNMDWVWIALGGVALAGGGYWGIGTVIRKKKSARDFAGDREDKTTGT